MTNTKAVVAAKENDKAVVAAKENTTAVAVVDEASLFEHGAEGFENVQARHVLLPRLTILQQLSPQLNKKKAEFIDGAEVGLICNTGTNALYEQITFVPVYFREEFIEWFPRSTGKGIAAIHKDIAILKTCERDDNGFYTNADGNYINETIVWYGFILETGERVAISMARTQIKSSKQLVAKTLNQKRVNPATGQKVNLPIYGAAYTLSTAERSKNEDTWSVWRIGEDKQLPDILPASELNSFLAECRDFRVSIINNEVSADHADEDGGAPTEDAGSGDSKAM